MNLHEIKAAFGTLASKVETLWKERGNKSEEIQNSINGVKTAFEDISKAHDSIIAKADEVEKANLDLKNQVEDLQAKVGELEAKDKESQATISTLQKNAKTTGQQAAIIAAKQGIQNPLTIAPDKGEQGQNVASIAEQYAAMEPGPDKTRFYRSNKAAILADAAKKRAK